MPNEVEYDVRLDLQNFRRDLQRIEQGFTRSTRSINSAIASTNRSMGGSVSGGVFAGMIQAEAVKKAMSVAVDAIKSGMSKIVSETGQLETATVKWEVLLGSAEAASAAIKDIFEFSNKTPFTFKGVNEAAQTIYNLSNGALDGQKNLKLLGDSAAKGGVPMEQLATTWGRLYQKFEQGDTAFADEINRMNELGIITGDTKKELQEMDSQMLQAEGWDAFIKGAESAEGMMEKLSTTIEGKISTLKGVWDGVFAFEDEKVQKGIKDSIDVLIKTLEDNKPELQAMLTDIFGVISKVISGMIIEVTNLWNYFHPELKQLKDFEFKATAELHQLRTNLNKKEQLQKLKDLNEFERKSKKQITQEGSFSFKPTKGEANYDALIARYNTETELQEAVKSGDLVKVLKILDETTRKLPEEMEKLAKDFVYNESLRLKLESEIGKISKTYIGKVLDKKQSFDAPQIWKDDPNNKKATGTDTSTSSILDNVDVNTNPLFKSLDGSFEDRILSLAGTGKVKSLEDEMFFSGFMVNAENALNKQSESINKLNDESLENQRIADEKMLEQQAKFYSDSISIIRSSENTIVGLHQAFTSGKGSGVLGGLSTATSGASNILKTLGYADPSGATSILSGIFSLGSTVSSFFEDDDTDEPSAQDIASKNASTRANIVSSGVDTVNLTVNFEVYSTYTDTDGMDEMFSKDIMPRFRDAIDGAYGSK